MLKPKVCMTTLEYPPDVGGVGESVHRIAKLLMAEGYEVHVAVFRSKQRFVGEGPRRRANCQTTCQDGVYVHRIQSAAREAVPEIQDFFSDVYFYLKSLHQQHQFDLFHAFFLNEAGYVTTLLAKEENVPVINSVRGSDLHKHIFNPKTHGQITWVLENSAWVTFVSRDLQRRGIALAPSVQRKSAAFWNSIAPIDFTAFPKPTLIDQLSGVVLGSTGRFRDKKGIEYLLDACTQLSDLDFTLLLIGDFVEKERPYWQQQIDAAGLGKRLHITGITSRAEALAYLPYLDIFVIPSLHDGCPNAMLEAMLAGCAIIGSDVDAIGEILADGTAGLAVAPGNADALAAAIRQLATDPELRHSLGVSAFTKALSHLAPEVEAQNWRMVYQCALQIEDCVPQQAVSPSKL
jgi:L-malate glycosyltransferase